MLVIQLGELMTLFVIAFCINTILKQENVMFFLSSKDTHMETATEEMLLT